MRVNSDFHKSLLVKVIKYSGYSPYFFKADETGKIRSSAKGSGQAFE